ncbi:3-beta hydroxysteroid dehydrogenase/isomerase family protein [Thelephora ganbajun]|uniref:3-beta hydroxysteroid dehydrogenase/isomerase family protein n=1 Tax=Thelephora ganbajun TaxID=370292 RepID=A0ACB6ZUC2_THEGA|nr:3-beta hydroxysteroid dehydrogenase/isomerase family protein [Thelephora ganbajun]
MSLAPRYVLVTGATGFVGAHVVDLLLERGIKVTGTARSQSKANEMKTRRTQYGDLFSMTITGEITAPNVFDNAVQDVDVVIHVASPVPRGTGISSSEQDIVLPAIKGTQSILKSMEKSPLVKRVVLTSSFGALFDKSRDPNEPYTYTSEDWNPATYEEAVVCSPSSVNTNGEKIDLTVFCPPIVFGPWVHPLEKIWSLGITRDSFAAARSTTWVDVRDLALAHVEAAYIRPETNNKRFVVCSPEKSSYQEETQIIKEEFPEWSEKVALPPGGLPRAKTTLDGSPLTKELGIKYTSSRECMVALAKQLHDQAVKEGLLAL